MATAVLVDADFFMRRYRAIYGSTSARDLAIELHKMCLKHCHNQKDKNDHYLYRILVYDCPPMRKKVHHPITSRSIDFSKSSVAKYRDDFHAELRKLRKVALRLGYLNEDTAAWRIKPEPGLKLMRGEIVLTDLDSERDVVYEARQKGVDMKIGIDIASLAYKRLVDQIVLIAGDSDFVPAAKLARREGIDFILDPMWHHIRHDLHEHIDGLKSVCKKPSADLMRS